MKVRCIDASLSKGCLTEGKEYEVIRETHFGDSFEHPESYIVSEYFEVIQDYGCPNLFYQERFEKIT